MNYCFRLDCSNSHEQAEDETTTLLVNRGSHLCLVLVCHGNERGDVVYGHTLPQESLTYSLQLLHTIRVCQIQKTCKHSFIDSFTHAPIHPCTHSPMHPFTHAPIHPCPHSPMPMHPFTQTLAHTHLHSHTMKHILTQTHTHTYTHTLSLSLSLSLSPTVSSMARFSTLSV